MRDFLGHSNLATTSRYLRSTAMRLERALRLLEELQEVSERTPPMVREGDSRSITTPVPHERCARPNRDLDNDPEVVDAIEDGVVSRIFASWNQIAGWLRRLEGLRRAA